MIDQIILNQEGDLEIDVYYNGALSTADSIIVRTITYPNGDPFGSDVPVESVDGVTGRYRCTIPSGEFDTLGIYTAIWEFVISGDTFTYTQQFEVVESMVRGYLTPYELRQLSTYSGITDATPTDAELQKYIDKASDMVDSYVGGSLLYSQYVEKRRCVLDKAHNGLVVRTKHAPIVSVSSISIQTTPTSTTAVSANMMRIKEDTGIIEIFPSLPGLQACVRNMHSSSIIPIATITYFAGYEIIPQDVVRAVALVSESVMKDSIGDLELSSYTIGDYKETYRANNTAKTSVGGNNWSMVQKILNKYRQSSESAGIAGILG